MRVTCTLLLLVFCSSLPVLSETTDVMPGTEANPHQVPRLNTEINIDGTLDEAAWQDALTLSLDWEYWPGDNTPAPVKTEFLLLYDNDNIYAGVRCYDPDPERISAHYVNRDEIFDDNDWIRLWFDTFNDGRKSFVFGSNALGVQGDGTWADSSLDWSWDALYETAAVIHDWGYSIEFAIPFNQLTFRNTDGKRVWAITCERGYPRDAWRIMGMFQFDGNLSRWLFALPKFEGFEGVEPGRNIEINPTMTAFRTEERDGFPDGDMEESNQETDFGVSARWGVTPNITLNGTINPDFSQVEADALQMDINEPFALEYREKRPFFTEGADFFRTRISAMYTRSFRDPEMGFKAIGKIQSDMFGGYLVRDEITNIIFPGARSSSSTTLAGKNWAGVARYRRELGSGNFIGAVATGREGDDYHNRIVAVDGKMQVTGSDAVVFEVLGSNTRYPDHIAAEFDQPADEFGDIAFYTNFVHDGRILDYGISYMDIGKNFRSDTGFLPQVDIRRLNVSSTYKWLPAEPSWYWRMALTGSAKQIEDHDGNLISRTIGPTFLYNGPFHIEANFDLLQVKENFEGQDFNQKKFIWDVSFRPMDNYRIGFSGEVGDRIDYANVRAGERLRIEPSISSYFGRHLQVSLDHTFERLTVDAGRLYTANISRFSMMYKFNKRALLRSMLQYVNYDRAVELYVTETEAKYEHLYMQLLFSYQINPRTVLYLGYTDNYFGTIDYDLTQNDRTVFCKIGYAWLP